MASNQHMIPIPIGEFVFGLVLPVNVYVKISDHKFVCLGRGGQRAKKEHFLQYADKKVHYLWVQKDEYAKISQQAIAIAGIVITKSSITPLQKTQVVSAAAKHVFTDLEHNGISLSMYNDAKQITETTICLIETHDSLGSLMESLNNTSGELMRHSVAVSALSAMIGSAIGWEKRSTIEKLALGGLLHDIGLKALPAEILKTPRIMMSREETQIYETHAFKGLQLLQSLGIVPDDIVSIVYEHHENSIGQGFPQRIRDVKIHPLARVVALADQFVHLTIKDINNPHPKNPREALMFIQMTMGQPFNKEAFQGLQKVIQGDLMKSFAG